MCHLSIKRFIEYDQSTGTMIMDNNQRSSVFDAKHIFHAAVHAVSPFQLSDFPLDSMDMKSMHVVGAGKASMAMAATLEQTFPNHSWNGHVVVPHGYIASFPVDQMPPQRIRVVEGGHPHPDQASHQSATEALQIAEALGDDDTLVVLLSGGASALWSLPHSGLTLKDQQTINRKLLECGADIHQINTIRKHLSAIKGGQLAYGAWPARTITIAISDVIEDDESVIGSGPTVPDPTTSQDCLEILKNYDIHVPPSVFNHLQLGVNHQRLETPKPGSKRLEKSSFHLMASNADALRAAHQMATELGYEVISTEEGIQGEAREIGRIMAQRLLRIRPGKCFIWGGETTVTLQGSGKGGRNQELALAAAYELKGMDVDGVLLSGGTDGIDGPTDAAGAWATPQTVPLAQSKGLDPEEALRNNDAYHCLKPIHHLLITGPTHTNVMDIGIALRHHE